MDAWQLFKTAPKGEVIVGLKRYRMSSGPHEFIGEVSDFIPSALIDKRTGYFAKCSHWRPMDDERRLASLTSLSQTGPSLSPVTDNAMTDELNRAVEQAVLDTWKAEANNLRRIVMEALAEHDRKHPMVSYPEGHWTHRAREALNEEG